MAAGLTLKKKNFTAFAAAFDEQMRRHLSEEDLRGIVLSDGELAPEHMTLDLAELLRRAGPWGQAFPEPLFDGAFEIISQRIIGQRHLKMMVKSPGSERLLDAIAFNNDALPGASPLRLAYKLDVNEYRGERSAQLLIEHIETL